MGGPHQLPYHYHLHWVHPFTSAHMLMISSRYFSTDDAVEKQFDKVLGDELQVDFMGTDKWFLGLQSNW